ncbi:MAG: hypothetical protein NVSMB26_11360 [Beijerinckiaceae bacterium]
MAAGAYAPLYRYSYVPAYVLLYPPHVFRCYPARAAVVDQVGLIAGYLNLGRCG